MSEFVRPINKSQQGVALFIALVMLLIMTVVGVSAVSTTSLEQRMARNTRDSLLAFHAAEAALREAEDVCEGFVSVAQFDDVGTDGLWEGQDFDEVPIWERAGVWDGATSVQAVAAVDGVAQAPRYLIEHIATVVREEDKNTIGNDFDADAKTLIEIFRITARGVGGTANARVLLQSHYGRILN